ncbi:MAG: acetyl/propionyl/methylcrotonyl-CoA carboxylase subunit alpha [Parvularculaceae bacterium]
MTIRKILIANRGEIACRIMRTAKARGIETVAVYSDADKNAYHVRMADEAVRIGGPAPAESYLNIEAIIGAAKSSGADAVHPGYGFLSERADFARACAEAGIIFIGPPAAAMAAMGDKAKARRRMLAAGVPCVPGYDGEDQSDARLAKEAKTIGFPIMVKAAAGGGGRGMRVVEKAAALNNALASARKEAENAFGDGRLLIEKLVGGARHVEIQVIADAHGNIVHLGERDCSLQRRRQKVIEEAPSPAITPELREAMGAAAVEAARAAGYVNAGTVEFLFDPTTQEFFFLEMNARLQVEHPVTELVTGLDLVGLQFDVAEGKKLPFGQGEVSVSGCAIEARLYAEDPAQGFLPQTGRITHLQFPDMPGLRVDAGVETGDAVSAYYDPMIAKVIAFAPTRDEARKKLADTLEEIVIFGLTTNVSFLVLLLRDEGFTNGAADTGYIEANLERLNGEASPVSALDVALAASTLVDASHGALLAGWNSRGETEFPLNLQHGDETLDAQANFDGSKLTVRFGEENAVIVLDNRDGARLHFLHDGEAQSAWAVRAGDAVDIKAGPVARRFVDMTYAPAGAAGTGADAIIAPMAGAVTGVFVRPGDTVEKGQIVAAIEAMKMEHRLAAPRDGVVETVSVKVGDQVAIRAELVTLKAFEC